MGLYIGKVDRRWLSRVLLIMLLEQGHHAAVAAQDVAEPHRHKFRFAAPVHHLHHHLAQALGRAHDVGGVHRLVRGDQQIAHGGPVTVTHPEITRFFMTIPEAVSLVLQAGYYARGGEIFVLDMGQPVKIDDMARQLIRLSGYEPDVDIPIIYTGLRPGEKLYEELLMDEEGLRETANQLIHIGQPINMDDEAFCRQLAVLERACQSNSPDIRQYVADMVPTYHPKTDQS